MQEIVDVFGDELPPAIPQLSVRATVIKQAPLFDKAVMDLLGDMGMFLNQTDGDGYEHIECVNIDCHGHREGGTKYLPLGSNNHYQRHYYCHHSNPTCEEFHTNDFIAWCRSHGVDIPEAPSIDMLHELRGKHGRLDGAQEFVGLAVIDTWAAVVKRIVWSLQYHGLSLPGVNTIVTANLDHLPMLPKAVVAAKIANEYARAKSNLDIDDDVLKQFAKLRHIYSEVK